MVAPAVPDSRASPRVYYQVTKLPSALMEFADPLPATAAAAAALKAKGDLEGAEPLLRECDSACEA